MKTLIVYATKHGCAEKCAHRISAELQDEVTLFNLKDLKNVDLDQYEKVIIGGSMHIGQIQKEVKDFCKNNLAQLKEKKLGLFICCMREGEIAAQELKDAYPEELLNIAVAKEYFGGEFTFKKMNFMDRLIVKKVAKIDHDQSNLLDENIYGFISLMNNA